MLMGTKQLQPLHEDDNHPAQNLGSAATFHGQHGKSAFVRSWLVKRISHCQYLGAAEATNAKATPCNGLCGVGNQSYDGGSIIDGNMHLFE